MKLICISILLFSCTPKRDSKLIEKEDDLKNYYKNVIKTKTPENGIVIILQNQRCSSCRFETFLAFSKILNKNTSPKTVIMPKPDTALTNLIENKKLLQIKLDTLHKLKDYGLDYASDLFFLYKDGTLKKWLEISNVNIDSLKSLE